MNTKTFWSHKRNLMLTGLLLVTAACGGGGGGVSLDLTSSNSVVKDSPGGIWFGIDSAGDGVLALVTETGRFHFLEITTGFQGSGTLDVLFIDQILENFRLVASIGGPAFSDGSLYADCKLSGTVAERQTMSLTVDCTTTAGQQKLTTVALVYDTLYERDSSLTTIAGIYDDGAGNVLNITADGTIFEQDASTGCVTNGLVTVINSTFNAYNIELGISNCIGQDAVLNGSSFVGLGTLDNTFVPEQLLLALTGDVAGTNVSLVEFSERL